MKTSIFLLIFAFLVTGVNFAQDKGAQQKNTVVGAFGKIIKDVYYIKLSGKPVKVEQKDRAKYPLYSQDEIRTEDNSIAIVKFIEGSVLTVQPNSLVTIHGDKENKGAKSPMQANTIVKKGSTYFKVEKQKDNSDFKFTTPTMVASIRGTAGLVKADNDTVNTFTVEEGLVYVEALKGTLGNGNVQAGKTATVSASGQVLITDTDPILKKELTKAKNSVNKCIQIKATDGSVIIYYDDEKK